MSHQAGTFQMLNRNSFVFLYVRFDGFWLSVRNQLFEWYFISILDSFPGGFLHRNHRVIACSRDLITVHSHVDMVAFASLALVLVTDFGWLWAPGFCSLFPRESNAASEIYFSHANAMQRIRRVNIFRYNLMHASLKWPGRNLFCCIAFATESKGRSNSHQIIIIRLYSVYYVIVHMVLIK